MGDKVYVQEATCQERCDNIKKISKMADKGLEKWLEGLDSKFWAVILLTIASLLSSVGALVVLLYMLIYNGGGS